MSFVPKNFFFYKRDSVNTPKALYPLKSYKTVTLWQSQKSLYFDNGTCKWCEAVAISKKRKKKISKYAQS